jgi:Ring finger domain
MASNNLPTVRMDPMSIIMQRHVEAVSSRPARRVAVLPVGIHTYLVPRPRQRNIFEYVAELLALGPPRQYEFVYANVNVEGLNWMCPVCLKKDLNNTVVHPCNCHVFHSQCLQQWMAQQITCPMCRQSIQPMKMKEKTGLY